MIPERNFKGKYAKSVFYHQYNNLDIYVEDTAKGTEKLYNIIFSRAFGSEIKIATVFPLGNRDVVITACKSDSSEDGRRRMYVVDGDFYLLSGNLPKLKRLFVLNRYCLENYLIDENAILEILFEEDLEKDKSEIRNQFDYQSWINANGKDLFELFLIYTLINKHDLDLETVGYKIFKLMNSDPAQGLVDTEKVQQRVKLLEDQIKLKIGEETYLKEKADILNRVENDKVPLRVIKYVSGKDYLLPLLLIRMRRFVKLKADNKVIKQRIALKCDVSELSKAKEVIC